MIVVAECPDRLLVKPTMEICGVDCEADDEESDDDEAGHEGE